MTTMLDAIVARTRRENARRARRRAVLPIGADATPDASVLARLRRPPGAHVRVIAEVKFRSPSAGQLRQRRPGDAVALAEGFARAGASAVSVLADAQAFGGGVLDVRRVAAATALPVLFKGFVLDEIQLDLAQAVGARCVLVLVRCLDEATLQRLVSGALRRGLHPVVEAMDVSELRRALATDATIVGVNARDLGTFVVDVARAERVLDEVPQGRIAVQMSGLRDREAFLRAGAGRADAVLVGEGLMRAPDPPAQLRALLAS